MFEKLKFGSTIAALILFAFPWLDIQCSEKSMATQTGFQVIYGGGSPSDEMKELGNDNEAKDESKPDELGNSPLIGLALVSVIAAVVFSSLALFRGSDRANRYASILPAVALALILLQITIGFPAKKKILESMSEDTSKARSSQTTDDAFSGLGESMATAMKMNIKVKTTPALYLELFALGIPTLLLLNSLIDKYKKQGEQALRDIR